MGLFYQETSQYNINSIININNTTKDHKHDFKSNKNWLDVG